MKKRVITGAIIFVTTALAILSKLLPYNIGMYVFDIFAVGISIVAGMEIANIFTKTGRKINPIIVSAYSVFNYIILLLVDKFLSFDYFLVFEFFALIFYFGFVFIYELIENKTESKKDILMKSLNTIAACIYPILLFMLIVMINHIDAYAGIKNFSLIFIVMIFAITMLTDTMAFAVGCTLKGPKLAPSISPNKTISGAIGGLVGGVIASMLTYLVIAKVESLSLILSMYGLTWGHFLVFGLIGSALGQIGDLFESKLKRMSNIKDSGTIFPGHGGMLDRIDALTFVTTFIFVCITLVVA